MGKVDERIKLFQTVRTLANKGAVTLSATDKRKIDQETKELIRRSMVSRTASEAPEGFKDLLNELKSAEDADAAYDLVCEFLAKDKADDEVGESDEPEKKDPEDKDEPEKKEPEDKKDSGSDVDLDEKKPEKEDFGDFVKDEGDFVDDEEKPKKDMAMTIARRRAIRKAQDLDLLKKDKDMGPMDKGPGKGPGDGKGPMDKGPKDKDPEDMLDDKKDKPDSLKDLQKKEEKPRDKLTKDEMGMEEIPLSDSKSLSDSKVPMAVAKKFKVRITPEKNIVATHADLGPIFIATPTNDIKKDASKLRRTANKVFGLLIFEGPRVAAEKCGARLLAGADDGIETDTQEEIPPNTDDVTDNADTDTEVSHDPDPSNIVEDADTDTEEKQDTITARAARVKRQLERTRKARYSIINKKSQTTSLDDADTDAQDKNPVSPSSLDSSADADTDTQESNDTPESSVLDEGETDFTTVEANYKKLYEARAAKKVKSDFEKFVNRFSRCVRIAAQRMHLNHYDHPYKAAAVDILTADDVIFSDGELFVPMDGKTAQELVELISNEGNSPFISMLLGKTADLMEKSDSYLEDVEKDIEDLAPTPVDVSININVGEDAISEDKVSSLRRSASNGNFDRSPTAPAPVDLNDIGSAFGMTKAARELSALRKIKG